MAYTISKGDTLYQIAKDYGTTVSALKEANNNVDPYKLQIGGSLNIPGQNKPNGGGAGGYNGSSGSYSGSSGSYSGSSGSYSGGYGGGSGQSTGYGPVTNYTYDRNDNPIAHQGFEKLGTSFNPDTGYLEHSSGYKGQAKLGPNGRYYTNYGSLIREDNHLYPEGAKLSPNGMYFDTGNGWQNANHGKEFHFGQGWEHLVPGDFYGQAPGSSAGFFGGGGGGQQTVQDTISEIVNPTPKPVETPTMDDIEHKRKQEAWAQGLLG